MNIIQKIKVISDFVGPKMPAKEYKNYKNVLNTVQQKVNKTASTGFYFIPTKNRIVNLYGGDKNELLSTLQSYEFVDNIFKILKKKGYNLPENTFFTEEMLPSWSNILAITEGENILLNPRSINRINPRIIFHEIGHFLHNKINKTIGFIANFISKKDNYIPFLSDQELKIFTQDIERAYKEGNYRGLPVKYWAKDKLFCFGEMKNKNIKNYIKNAIKINTLNPMYDRYEFVAEVFSLSVQGFKFSPEIMAKYEQFGGPKIKETLSKNELEQLLKLQKQIRKKTLKDYNL